MGHVEPYFDASPSWDGGSNDPAGWRYEARIKNRQDNDMSQWYGRLLGDPLFVGDLRARFEALQAGGALSLANITAEVDRLALELTHSNATVRNWDKTPPPSGTTHGQAISDLKQWLTARLAWMTTAIKQDMFHTGAAHSSFCNVETKISGNGPPRRLLAASAASRRLLGMNCPLDCWGPYTGFPLCQSRMEWMTANWKTDPKFAAGGVDGTTCSFQKFLFNENSTICPNPCFPDPVRDANGCETTCSGPWLYYPKCSANIDWLVSNWQTNPKYAAGGVDGSRCSAQKFVHTESGKCPAVCKPGCSTGDCEPPSEGYPSCSRDMQWVAANWEKDAKFAAGGVNGTSCSIQDFIFRENATICPRPCVAAPTAAAPTAVVAPTSPPSQQTPTTPTTPPTVLAPTAAAPTSPTPVVRSCRGTCYGPYPGFPGCQYNIELMKQDAPANATQCDLQLQLAGRGICPYLPMGLECMENNLCKQNPTAPTRSAPTTYTSPTNSKVTEPLEEGGSPAGTFFAVFVPLLAIIALGLAFYYYRKRTANRWKHAHLQDDQEPVLLPYSQQLK